MITKRKSNKLLASKGNQLLVNSHGHEIPEVISTWMRREEEISAYPVSKAELKGSRLYSSRMDENWSAVAERKSRVARDFNNKSTFLPTTQRSIDTVLYIRPALREMISVSRERRFQRSDSAKINRFRKRYK